MSEGRTLEVLVGLDLLGASQRLLVRHRLHTLLSERLEGGSVFSKIKLGSDKDNGNVRRMMINLRIPLERVSAESTCCGDKGAAYLCLHVVE